MKHVQQYLLLFALLPTLSHALSLLPADDVKCIAAFSLTHENSCEVHEDFYFDQNGKCGCLPTDSIKPFATCTDLACDASDENISNLFKYRDQQGLIEIVQAGCGCFFKKEGSTKLKNISIENKKIEIGIPCSISALIMAINEANTAGSGTLKLASNCDYQIFNPATANEGLPIITGNITIIGALSTTISRALAAPAFRIFTINAGATLNISRVRIENGQSSGLGGAILTNGTLIANGITLANNSASNGGGISVLAGATATISQSLLVRNSANSVGGGAIISFANATIESSILEENTAAINGGGINVQPSGIVTSKSSTFSANTSAGLGGAISTLGTVSTYRTLIEANKGSSGGGIATGNNNVSLNISIVRHNSPDNCSPLNTIAGCVN